MPISQTAAGIPAVDRNGKISHINRRFFKIWVIPWEVKPENDGSELISFVHEKLRDPDCFLIRGRESSPSPPGTRGEIRFRDGGIFGQYSIPARIGEEATGQA